MSDELRRLIDEEQFGSRRPERRVFTITTSRPHADDVASDARKQGRSVRTFEREVRAAGLRIPIVVVVDMGPRAGRRKPE